MSFTTCFATLYHKARTGFVHSWDIKVEGDTIVSTHGIIGGSKVVSRKKATGKNIGRSNETTPEQQALIEARAMHKHKLERKYSLTVADAQEDLTLPMLAHDFEKRGKNVKYPIDVQPKLDGVRALARWEGDKVVLTSRSGKPWLVTTHLNKQLEQIMPKGTVLDGEIYLHGKGFQWITSLVKKLKPDTKLLEFHVYDMPEVNGDDSLTWLERKEDLYNFAEIADGTEHIKVIHTGVATSRENLKAIHDKWVGLGYEGLIARTRDGIYEWGHRSASLLKVKDFQDAEFVIVGHTSEDVERTNSDGTKISMKAVIWKCRDEATGQTFETRPRGSHQERAYRYDNAHLYYGLPLKVRYFGLTDKGLPRFPIGVGFRASEDM